MDKVNIWIIFIDHFKTLKNFSSNKYSILDFLIFYAVPIAVGLFVALQVQANFLISANAELIAFFGVLGGFMLNLLVLICGYDSKKFKNESLAKEVLFQVKSNVSYLIALACCMILILFVLKLVSLSGLGQSLVVYGYNLRLPVLNLIEGLSIAVFLNFGLTILMVLKRFYSLERDSSKA